MSRDLSTTIKNALAASYVEVCYLVSLDFIDQTIDVTTWRGDVAYNDKLYGANGYLTDVNSIQHQADTKAAGVTLTFSGAPTALIETFLSTPYHSTRCEILTCLIADEVVLNYPFTMFQGFLDTCQFEDDGKQAVIKANFEPKTRNLNKTLGFRYSPESQKALYPTDMGFEFVAALADFKGWWGRNSRPKLRKTRSTNRTK